MQSNQYGIMDFKPKSISESYYCTTIYYCTNLCSLYSILYIYKSSLYFRSDRLLLQKYLQGSRILVHQWTNVVWIGKLFGDVRAVKQARHTRRHETGRVAGNHRRGDEFRNDRLHAGLCEGRQDRHRDANAPDNDDDNDYNNWCDHETCRRYLVAREWNFNPAKVRTT